MYVRDAKNRDEVWLLDRVEELGLDDAAFRSRDYVIAVDEETNDRAGFGRIRVHKADENPADQESRASGRRPRSTEDLCELTGIGVLEAWRGQGVGAHVIERLIQKAGDEGFEAAYSLTDEPTYLAQFGFEPIESEALPSTIRERLDEKRASVMPDAVAVVLDVDEFSMPERLRERFKTAEPAEPTTETDVVDPEDFGIDPDSATYKYDTGG